MFWGQTVTDTVIDNITKEHDTLYEAQLFLGEKIDRIRIMYDTGFNSDLPNFINHNKGDDYFELDIAQLENVLSTLNSKIAEQGDPFSTLQLVNISKQSSDLISADLKIVSNQKRRIDKIIVKGYEKFPQSYIKRFMKLRTGKTFNLNEIKEKEARPFPFRFLFRFRFTLDGRATPSKRRTSRPRTDRLRSPLRRGVASTRRAWRGRTPAASKAPTPAHCAFPRRPTSGCERFRPSPRRRAQHMDPALWIRRDRGAHL